MFRTSPMLELEAVVLTEDESAVLKGIGELCVMELIHNKSEIRSEELALQNLPDKSARLDRIRSRVDQIRRSLEIEIASDSPQTATMTLDEAEKQLSSMEERLSGTAERHRVLMQRREELAVASEELSWHDGFDIPLDDDRFHFIHFVTGIMALKYFENIKKNTGDDIILIPIKQQKGRQSLALITSRQGATAVDTLLQSTDFQQTTLPVIPGATVDRQLEETRVEQGQVASEIEQLHKYKQLLSEEFSRPLAEIERFTDMEYRIIEAGRILPHTRSTTLLTGWTPAVDAEQVKQSLEKSTNGRYILKSSVPDTEESGRIPVLLRHTSWLRPFEILVSTYGLPVYGELEPTLFVALSYMLMFGMMFGDAGHGIVLVLCGFLAIFLDRSDRIRDFGLLLCFAGLSSIIFGIIYGSCFGVETFKKYALWHDPLEGNPIGLMIFAIGFGIMMISLGLILNVINRLRRGDMIGGFLDKFGLAGLVFYWGTLALIIFPSTIQSLGLKDAWIGLCIVLPMVGWAVKEPLAHMLNRATTGHDGGLAGCFIESLVGTFEAVLGYLANTISFVRLAAYAMSHAALLVAAFVLAAQIRHVSPGGEALRILIVILGNMAAIVLEGVIASVQALRLEYYEFFGKFFSGSGRPFEPFRLFPEGERTR